MADKSEAIEKAVVTLHQLSEDEKIKLQCEARERYWMDWQSSMRTNFEKGAPTQKKNALTRKKNALTKLMLRSTACSWKLRD